MTQVTPVAREVFGLVEFCEIMEIINTSKYRDNCGGGAMYVFLKPAGIRGEWFAGNGYQWRQPDNPFTADVSVRQSEARIHFEPLAISSFTNVVSIGGGCISLTDPSTKKDYVVVGSFQEAAKLSGVPVEQKVVLPIDDALAEAGEAVEEVSRSNSMIRKFYKDSMMKRIDDARLAHASL